MEAEQRPMAAAAEIHSHELSMLESAFAAERDGSASPALQPPNVSGGKLGFAERAFSAAGAAFLSAIIVNPLDVAKVIFYFFYFSCSICFLGSERNMK